VWFPIGHQALFVPCVAFGDACLQRWPQLEQRSTAASARGPLLGAQFWPQFFASFLSPLAAAASVLVLIALCRRLGASPREAIGIVVVATLCTQFWPGSAETVSNAPGALFLYATVLGFAHYSSGASARALLAAGSCAGVAVLIR
jgi:hypothetical protein